MLYCPTLCVYTDADCFLMWTSTRL